MRELILADRHEIGLAEEDVGRLVHRVGQQQPAHGAPVGGFQLRLDGGVAVQFGLGDQRQEGQHELVGRGHGRVGEDRRAVRVHAHGQGVGHQRQDALADGAHAVAVGDDLVVGDENPGVDAAVLDRLPRVHGAEVVTQVHIARGAHAGEHAVAVRVDVQVGLDLGGPSHRVRQRGGVGAGGQGLLGGREGGGHGGRGGVDRGLRHSAILEAAERRGDGPMRTAPHHADPGRGDGGCPPCADRRCPRWAPRTAAAILTPHESAEQRARSRRLAS